MSLPLCKTWATQFTWISHIKVNVYLGQFSCMCTVCFRLTYHCSLLSGEDVLRSRGLYRSAVTAWLPDFSPALTSRTFQLSPLSLPSEHAHASIYSSLYMIAFSVPSRMISARIGVGSRCPFYLFLNLNHLCLSLFALYEFCFSTSTDGFGCWVYYLLS